MTRRRVGLEDWRLVVRADGSTRTGLLLLTLLLALALGFAVGYVTGRLG